MFAVHVDTRRQVLAWSLALVGTLAAVSLGVRLLG